MSAFAIGAAIDAAEAVQLVLDDDCAGHLRGRRRARRR